MLVAMLFIIGHLRELFKKARRLPMGRRGRTDHPSHSWGGPQAILTLLLCFSSRRASRVCLCYTAHHFLCADPVAGKIWGP